MFAGRGLLNKLSGEVELALGKVVAGVEVWRVAAFVRLRILGGKGFERSEKVGATVGATVFVGAGVGVGESVVETGFALKSPPYELPEDEDVGIGALKIERRSSMVILDPVRSVPQLWHTSYRRRHR